MILHRSLSGLMVSLGGHRGIMERLVFEVFCQCAEVGVPMAAVWTIGTWVVNTILDWVTGRGNRL